MCVCMRESVGHTHWHVHQLPHAGRPGGLCSHLCCDCAPGDTKRMNQIRRAGGCIANRWRRSIANSQILRCLRKCSLAPMPVHLCYPVYSSVCLHPFLIPFPSFILPCVNRLMHHLSQFSQSLPRFLNHTRVDGSCGRAHA